MGFTQSRHQSSDRQQRHSFGAQYQNQPPLPHLPQPHFYSAPDIDIPMLPGQAMRPAMEEVYTFCAFDTLPSPPLKPSKMGVKVLVVGKDGGLEVLALENEKTRLVGRIDGLDGRVVEAKLLTWASRVDPFAESRPLIAVILHGPVSPKEDVGVSSSGISDHNETIPGPATKLMPAEMRHKREEPTQFQTRVEVYSLKTQEYIATLFSTQAVAAIDNFPSLSLPSPRPVGNLKIHANGNFVVVASGTSGEVFVYSLIPSSAPGAYQCLGKTWTSVQSRYSRRYSNSSSSTDADDFQADTARGLASPEAPILSLCGRWLAIVSPSPPTRVSLHGTIPLSLVRKRIYGIDSHTPPHRPSVTCGVDSGEGESLFNKVARGVTQELFKGARWIGDQSLQTWHNYWNRESQLTQTAAVRRSTHPFEVQQAYNFLPPTHAQEVQSPVASEPELVSIIDLKRIEESQDIQTSFNNPIATFQPPNGCSYLSFAPNGLMILTASKKGDVQHVWDLMQIRHCRARAFIFDDSASSGTVSNPPALHVRQVARYARLTTSSIVDVVWTAPPGDRLAIVTKKGTVHVYDMPRNAFLWPPLRRTRPSVAATQKECSPKEEFLEEIASGNPFSAAMKLVGGKTQPILAAVRGRAPTVGAAFSSVGGFGISSATGVRGSKAVAAGLSKSVGAATGTVNTIRHAGENRLHLPGFARDVTASRVAWFGTQDEPLLALIDGGSVKIYKVRPSSSQKNAGQSATVIGAKIVEIRLPSYIQNWSDAEQAAPANARPHVTGFWSIPLSSFNNPSATKLKSQPLSQAEIEANAPYQPFHTDRRVNLMIYSPENGRQENGSGSPSRWVFGNPIPATRLHLRLATDSDDGGDVHDRNVGVGEMENLISLGSVANNVEHVLITTRRKKKPPSTAVAAGTGHDEDGFFEDDCDVLDFARDRV
jgi:WD40 repeat protein